VIDLVFLVAQAAVTDVHVPIGAVDLDIDRSEMDVTVPIALSQVLLEDPFGILGVTDISDQVPVAIRLIGVGRADAVVAVVRDAVVVQVVGGIPREDAAGAPGVEPLAGSRTVRAALGADPPAGVGVSAPISVAVWILAHLGMRRGGP
jgi:hypothetical protein